MTVKGGAIVLGAAFALVGLGSGLRPAHAAQLTKTEQARILKQGELSGLAEACGLDWEALSFRPMMAYWRRIGKSEDQMALIGILHGVGQGTAAAKPGACTDTMRRKIKAQLPFKG